LVFLCVQWKSGVVTSESQSPESVRESKGESLTGYLPF
jgi:hypothetical protein